MRNESGIVGVSKVNNEPLKQTLVMMRAININGKNVLYNAVAPRADDAKPEEGARVIFRHGGAGSESGFVLAEPELMTSGWVLGVNAIECE